MKQISKTSVIIVNYQADEYVRRMKQSLKGHPEIECIVIDTSDGTTGYGAGCSLGAQQARGETLLFTNPDVELSAQTVLNLHAFLLDHPSVGLVGPQILGEDGSVQITCSAIPTPLMASIVFSWLGTLPIFAQWSAAYRLHGFDHHTSRPVPSVSGSCFMMRRDEFLEIGGCDEQLFLYFEEFDLARRVHDHLEKQVYFLASTSIVHYGQKSTDQVTNVSRHFQNSRHYWLQKYYGWPGWLADRWLRLWEKSI